MKKNLFLAWEELLTDESFADEFKGVFIPLIEQFSLGVIINDDEPIKNINQQNSLFLSIDRFIDRKSLNRFYFNENDLSRSILIGKDYQQAILTGLQAGWFTVWYNPGNIACPGSVPLHHAEIDQIATLPLLLKQREMPSYYQCMLWFQKEGCAPGLWQHVECVAILSYHLALWLRRQGAQVDPIIAHRGGLLHDLAKLSTKRSGSNHGSRAGQILDSKGLPELAEIARKHPLFSILDEVNKPSTWEQKIVYFTDKLVEEGKLVSLEERLVALQERYPKDKEGIAKCRPALLLLQERFCSFLGVTDTGLMEQLSKVLSPYSGKKT
jgi:hypothetical protein